VRQRREPTFKQPRTGVLSAVWRAAKSPTANMISDDVFARAEFFTRQERPKVAPEFEGRLWSPNGYEIDADSDEMRLDYCARLPNRWVGRRPPHSAARALAMRNTSPSV
jgi:hypothetical protein